MKKLILKIASIAALMMLPAASVAIAAPPSKEDVCAGISVVSGSGSCDDGSSVSNVIAKGVEILAYIIGIAAIVVIILSGITLITANGDSGALSKAKNTILYATIGIFIAISARVIVSYVVNQASGSATSTGAPTTTTGSGNPGTGGSGGGLVPKP